MAALHAKSKFANRCNTILQLASGCEAGYLNRRKSSNSLKGKVWMEAAHTYNSSKWSGNNAVQSNKVDLWRFFFRMEAGLHSSHRSRRSRSDLGDSSCAVPKLHRRESVRLLVVDTYIAWWFHVSEFALFLFSFLNLPAWKVFRVFVLPPEGRFPNPSVRKVKQQRWLKRLTQKHTVIELLDTQWYTYYIIPLKQWMVWHHSIGLTA